MAYEPGFLSSSSRESRKEGHRVFMTFSLNAKNKSSGSPKPSPQLSQGYVNCSEASGCRMGSLAGKGEREETHVFAFLKNCDKIYVT